MENEQTLNAPYTEAEKDCEDALMKAHDLFMKLPRQHPNELETWIAAIHQQQMILGMRILRRDYPNDFVTIANDGK